MCNSGGFVPIALYVDARYVCAAITASCVRAPTDNSLLCHVLPARETRDNKVLSALFWLDTRDMIAGGMAKGLVVRGAIHVLTNYRMRFNRPAEAWELTGSLQIAGGSVDASFVRADAPLHTSTFFVRNFGEHSPGAVLSCFDCSRG